jgi:predicted RNA-binding protein
MGKTKKDIVGRANKVIEDLEEHIFIHDLIENRKKIKGKTYTLDEVKKIFKHNDRKKKKRS